jgi:hypothetical protein
MFANERRPSASPITASYLRPSTTSTSSEKTNTFLTPLARKHLPAVGTVVLRCQLVIAAPVAFQARSVNHSDISPFTDRFAGFSSTLMTNRGRRYSRQCISASRLRRAQYVQS